MAQIKHLVALILLLCFAGCGGNSGGDPVAQKAQIFEALLAGLRFDGADLAGGKVYFYSPGTTTAKAIYIDRDKTTEADNPYELDANGQAEIYGDGVYDIKVTTAAGVEKAYWYNVAINDSTAYYYKSSDYSSLSDALADIGVANASFLINSELSIDSNTTIPANINVTSITPGGFTIASGKTLTVNGQFDAGLYGVFSGSGSVSFGSRIVVYPQWFGAVADGATDDGTAVQVTSDSLSNGGTVRFVGSYLLNSQVSVTNDDVILDFTNATILNTDVIPDEVWQGQTVNPVIKINAHRASVIGGHFKDFVSQGVFAGGALNSPEPIASGTNNHKIGFTALNNKFTGLVDTGGVAGSRCVQTRHVDNVVIKNVYCEDIGVPKAGDYSPTLSVNYCNGAIISNCTVKAGNEGGAANMLYTHNGSISNNVFTEISNTGNGQYGVAMHTKFSDSIAIVGNIVSSVHSALKVSEDTNNVTITGNKFTVTGVNGTEVYAGVFLQGPTNVTFSNNVLHCTAGRAMYLAPHITTDVRHIVISNNYIRGNYDADTGLNQAAVTYGSGIQVNGGLLANKRGPILIENNLFHNCDVWMFQTTNSSVKGNFFQIDIDLFKVETSFSGTALTVAGGAAIWDESGTYNIISGNDITVSTASPAENRAGIRLMTTTYGVVANNVVRFLNSTTLSYDYLAQSSTTGMFWNNNVSFGTVNTSKIAGNNYFGCSDTPSGSVVGSAFVYDGTNSVDLHMSSATTSGDALIRFYNPNGAVGTITTSGSSTAYNTSSDHRLKQNVQSLSGSGEFIDALSPCTWEWRVDGSRGVGFVAHELQAVSPGSVTGVKDGVDSDGKPVYQAVAYGSPEIIANLVAEVKDLRRRLALIS